VHCAKQNDLCACTRESRGERLDLAERMLLQRLQMNLLAEMPARDLLEGFDLQADANQHRES
jgi:hypothetical protein